MIIPPYDPLTQFYGNRLLPWPDKTFRLHAQAMYSFSVRTIQHSMYSPSPYHKIGLICFRVEAGKENVRMYITAYQD